MRVFISWSGERSRACATALKSWLPRVLPGVEPWLSFESIPVGARWDQEVSRVLGQLHYGVLCLTPENVSAAWVLFEAGALSKSVSKSRVVPYLLGFEPRHLPAPLAQFQATRSDEPGTWALVRGINAAATAPLTERELSQAFQVQWPHLSSVLEALLEPHRPRAVRSRQSSKRGPRTSRSAGWRSESPADARHRIAQNVKTLRRAARMTQDEFAAQVGLSFLYVGQLEQGRVNVTVDSLTQIARTLKVPLRDLLDSP